MFGFSVVANPDPFWFLFALKLDQINNVPIRNGARCVCAFNNDPVFENAVLFSLLSGILERDLRSNAGENLV